MAVLPIQPTPFFADKNRAFWTLQSAGWGGAFLLRAITGLVGGQDWSFLVNVAIEAVTGFSISLVLSVIYQRLISVRPLVTWASTVLVLFVGVGIFTFIIAWVTNEQASVVVKLSLWVIVTSSGIRTTIHDNVCRLLTRNYQAICK